MQNKEMTSCTCAKSKRKEIKTWFLMKKGQMTDDKQLLMQYHDWLITPAVIATSHKCYPFWRATLILLRTVWLLSAAVLHVSDGINSRKAVKSCLPSVFAMVSLHKASRQNAWFSDTLSALSFKSLLLHSFLGWLYSMPRPPPMAP